MNKPIYIVDLIGEVVKATEQVIVNKKCNQKLIQVLQQVDSQITGLHYKHGHPMEIVNTLTEYSKGPSTKYDRFPLIALFQDFPEVMGSAPGFYTDVTLHLIIAKGTDPNYKAADRYEKNFKPILYPIYLNFIEQLKRSKAIEVISGGEIPHTKIDRLYWGREGLYGNTSNTFNDKVDCIEIKDLKLRIKTQNC